MPNFRLNVAMASHTGHVRDHNEDAVGYHYPAEFDTLSEKGALFVLADGVGGLPDGEKASDYAVQRLIELYYQTPRAMSIADSLVTSFEQINAEVYRDFEQELATTLVALVVRQDRVTIAHVGDSRVYYYDGQQMQLCTEDHIIVVQEGNRKKLRLTRAIGHQAHLTVDVHERPVSPDDIFLLASDGTHAYFSHSQLGALENDPQQIVTNIVIHSLKAGGRDNISVIVVVMDDMLNTAESLAQHVQDLTKGVFVDVSGTSKQVSTTTPIRKRRFPLLGVLFLFALALGIWLFIRPAENTSNSLSLLVGQTVVFDTVAVTYTQIDSTTSAFLIVPNTVYQVISTQINSSDQVWYQIYDEETDRNGWIIEAELPTHTTAD